MLNIYVDKNTEECKFEMRGDLPQNVTELFVAVGNMYGLLLQRNERLAGLFKKLIQAGCLDGSPVWDGEVLSGSVGAAIVSEPSEDKKTSI